MIIRPQLNRPSEFNPDGINRKVIPLGRQGKQHFQDCLLLKINIIDEIVKGTRLFLFVP